MARKRNACCGIHEEPHRSLDPAAWTSGTVATSTTALLRRSSASTPHSECLAIKVTNRHRQLTVPVQMSQALAPAPAPAAFTQRGVREIAAGLYFSPLL